MKRLDLYSISLATLDNKLITEDFYALVANVAKRNYQDPNLMVEAVFSGTTILSARIADDMAFENPAFANAHNFVGNISGLGDSTQFQRFFNEHVLIEMSRKNPYDAFEIMLLHKQFHFGFGLGTLRQNCLDAINYMFSLISAGGLGVGVFYDPFVALAAHFFDFEGARSLRDMEAISFVMDNGKISVLGIKEVVL